MLIFLIHVATTLSFIGIIWYAQLIQYPLLAYVGKQQTTTYEKEYYKRTMPLAISLLIIEALSGILLLWFKPFDVPAWAIWLNLGLLAAIWILTFSGCVRCHVQLTCNAYERPLQHLLKINWTRACIWTARGVLLLWMIALIAR